MRDDDVGGQQHGTQARRTRGLLRAEGVLQHERGQDHHGDECGEGGGEAQEPTRVEASKRQAPARMLLAHEHRGDDEAGDDEEDVDADEATGDRQPGMEGHDEPDRERAQALDVRAP